MKIGLVSMLAVLGACGPSVGGGADTQGSSSEATRDESAASASATATVGSTTAETGTSATTSTATSSSTTSSASADASDDGPSCILHETYNPNQCGSDADCCPGSKCVPVDLGTRCVEIARDPVPVGGECTSDGVVDDCAAGAVCWNVNPLRGLGICTEVCYRRMGACSDPTDICSGYYDVGVCIPGCDPVASACIDEELCLPDQLDMDGWLCGADSAPGAPGGWGEDCVEANECDAGFACVPDGTAEGADCSIGGSGCCSPYCDVDQPFVCDGPNEVCTPWADVFGEAPPGYEHVGVCAS